MCNVTKIKNNQGGELVIVIASERVVPQGITEFPSLGVARQTPDFVVLFSSPGVGTVVSPSADPQINHDFGQFTTDWDMDLFEPFTGNLLLRN